MFARFLIPFLLVTLARADDGPSLAAFPRAALTIATASARQHKFEIWVARTDAQQQRGLMFVTELRADQGMLFVEEPPRVMSMWMKNTLIPLDMLFIASDGRIAHIHERARPQDLTVIGYDAPVRAVLELRGGEAAKRGIRAGDRVASAVLPDLPATPR
jgi:uncharacterized membrane protein (UPF0127 family)